MALWPHGSRHKHDGNDSDHQERSQEEITYGSDSGEGNEGSRTEGQIDENEIGAGQVHQHNMQKRLSGHQRKRIKNARKRQISPDPDRPFMLPLNALVPKPKKN